MERPLTREDLKDKPRQTSKARECIESSVSVISALYRSGDTRRDIGEGNNLRFRTSGGVLLFAEGDFAKTEMMEGGGCVFAFRSAVYDLRSNFRVSITLLEEKGLMRKKSAVHGK